MNGIHRNRYCHSWSNSSRLYHLYKIYEVWRYSTFFGDGVDILGSRSPHILPGNIPVTENKHNYEIDEYFVFNS